MICNTRSFLVRANVACRFHGLWNQARLFTAAATDYDVAVIGGGPGGYVAAIKAAQCGLKTVCVEKRGTLGGTCLNVGCIPSKALLNATHHYHACLHDFSKFGIRFDGGATIDVAQMQAHKNKCVKGLTDGIEMLFKANKVEYVKGEASFASTTALKIRPLDQNRDSFEITAKNIIIATGSESSPLPGGDSSAAVDEETILSSTGALSLSEPPKSMVVVGGGVIGLELGSVYRRLGTEVFVVEFLDRILPPIDQEAARNLRSALERQGIRFMTSTKVTGITKTNVGAVVAVENVDAPKAETLNCEKVLIAVGRRPHTANLNLGGLGVSTDRFGRIPINDQTLQVENHTNIYAIGDVVRGAMLAHKAEEEGFAVAERIAGKSAHVNYDAVPAVVYTHPELAGVGKTEEQLKEENIEYKSSVFPFAANSRARANDDAEGFVKILIGNDDKLVGAWILGPQAGELISNFGIALEYGASSEDIGRVCYPHPSLSEAVKEACLGGFSKSIHFPSRKR